MREWTQGDLTQVCAQWQTILGLSEWEIAIRFGRGHSIRTECQGEVDFIRSKRQALITVLTPGDFPPNENFPQDIERTIVHELLHLHFGDVRTAETDYILEERAINSLSKGLVGLKRFFRDE